MRLHTPQRHIKHKPGKTGWQFGFMSHRGDMWSLLICLCLSFSSCTQKDLLFPDEGLCKVDIRFLWNNAIHASPEGMTVLFYPLEDDEEFWRYEIAGRDGGAVELPQGTYTMIAVNNDLSAIRLTDMPYESASLSVKTMPRSEEYGSPSGMVYMGKIDNLKISSQDATYNCYPDSLSTVCNIIAEDVAGMEKVRSASAIIEGFASGVFLSTLQPVMPSVEIPFNLDTDVGNQRFTGSTTGFLSNPSSASYLLTFRVAYKEGGAYEKTYDVTQQVINYFYQHNVYIIIKGLTLPEEPTIQPDEVGIKVDVDGWRVIDIDIDSSDY